MTITGYQFRDGDESMRTTTRVPLLGDKENVIRNRVLTDVLAAASSMSNGKHDEWKRHATASLSLLDTVSPALRIGLEAGTPEDLVSFICALIGVEPIPNAKLQALLEEVIPAYAGLHLWARSGFPHFTLCSDFFHAVAATDFGDPTDEPLYMPFDSFTVSFPPSPDFGNATRAFVHKVPSVNHAGAGKFIVKWPLYRAVLLTKSAIMTQWDIGMSRKQLAENPMVDSPISGTLNLEENEKLMSRRLRMLLGNVLSYTEASGPLPTVPRLHRAAPTAVELVHKTMPIFEVGRVVKLDGATRRALMVGSGDRAHWKLMQKYMVRGHWRNQVYGEGRALRRRKWIQPFWKGPQDVAAAIERTYEIE